MSKKIVVFGATGYTGDLVARALVARGARPVLAARSAERLQGLAKELGGLETRIADVSRPESVRALVQRGDVLVSTVGPFVRWGAPAIEAAIAAGATYLDSTGEPSFIRRVFDHHGPSARTAGCALITACGYDWIPGNLAGALALRKAGAAATRIEIGYFSRAGGSISGGTRASSVGALLQPGFTFRGGRLIRERSTAHTRSFEVAPGKHRIGATIGGTEHFQLPALHPQLRDVSVFLGVASAERMPLVSAVVAGITSLPGARAGLQALADRFVKVSTGGPDLATRAVGSSTIIAEAFDAQRKLLSRVQVGGVNGYTFTGDFLAWAAVEALERGVNGNGALGPVSAFGLDRLEAGVRESGMQAV